MHHYIRATDELVEAWTSRHIKFRGHNGNTEAENHYRSDLRRNIGRLKRGDSFSTSYACFSWPRSDIENLLLYNIALSKADFGNRRVLSFEKQTSDQMQPCPQLPDAVAYARYEVCERTASSTTGTIVNCQPVACTKGDFKSAGLMWKVFKAAEWHRGGRADDGAPLKLDVVLHAPASVNLIGVVKPVLDGFLSALHHRSESDADLTDVIERLTLKYGWQDQGELRRLLLDDVYAVLGNCKTPRRHKRIAPDSLMWSPDDHRVTQCQVRHDISVDGNWRIEGRMYA